MPPSGTQPFTYSRKGGYTFGAPEAPANYGSVSPVQEKQPPQEPAVISSSTISDTVIPQNNKKLDELSQKGTYSGDDGILRHADGSLVPAPLNAQPGDNNTWTADTGTYGAAPEYIPGEDPEASSMNEIIGSLRSSLDASTKSQIDTIHQNFAVERQAQQDANDRAGKARSASLLNLGTSRYAPFSASGTMQAETTFGLRQIQALDARENAAIAAAKKAQSDGDMQLMDKTLGFVQEIRNKKQDAAQKIIDQQQQRIQKSEQDRIQGSRESAVADLYSQGVTKPADLLNYLNYDGSGKQLGDFTLSEITDMLKNIVPPGLESIIKAAADNGAPPEVLAKIAAAGDMNAAYAAASGYTQKAQTGIVGEYQFYAQQAKAAGQTPVDFNTYQNLDANRKAKAAGNAGDKVLSVAEAASLGVPYGTKASEAYGKNPGADTTDSLAQQLVRGDLAPSELSKRATGSSSYNAVLKAADDYSMRTTGKHFSIAQADRDYKFANRPQTQDTLNYLGSLVGNNDGNGKMSGGNLDELIALSDSIGRTDFPALNNAEAWARMSAGDMKMAKFQAVATEVADQVAKILQGSGGSGTSDAKLQQATNLFNTRFSSKQMRGVVDALKPLLTNRAKSMVKDNPYLSDYAVQFGIEQPGISPTGEGLIQDEKDAQSSVVAAVKAKPELGTKVRALVGGTFEGIDHPLTYAEVLQYLQATNSI